MLLNFEFLVPVLPGQKISDTIYARPTYDTRHDINEVISACLSQVCLKVNHRALNILNFTNCR